MKDNDKNNNKLDNIGFIILIIFTIFMCAFINDYCTPRNDIDESIYLDADYR